MLAREADFLYYRGLINRACINLENIHLAASALLGVKVKWGDEIALNPPEVRTGELHEDQASNEKQMEVAALREGYLFKGPEYPGDILQIFVNDILYCGDLTATNNLAGAVQKIHELTKGIHADTRPSDPAELILQGLRDTELEVLINHMKGRAEHFV